ncbi:uncharacterized protein LOC118516507 [Anopheles stephensi]|uniref:uncharacterized protein LOC118516507 n=1 Tax=Anopheles stephensi TaxID=30069 RepID=UPI0016587E1D|nr:uncharacterized protein LOC118516507 [Anopheles stephensi]
MALEGHPAVVLAGDFNAWNEEWGSARTTQRGECLLGTVNHLGLQTLNRGSEPTFAGNEVARESVIDVSFASSNVVVPDGWSIVEKYSGNYHKYVTFGVAIPSMRANQHGRHQQPHHQQQRRGGPHNTSGLARHAEVRWKTAQFDRECFEVALSNSRFSLASTPEELLAGLTAACDGDMQRVHGPTFRLSPKMYWWTPEIERLRESCEDAEGRRHRAATPEDRAAASSDLLRQRRLLAQEILHSKDRCMQELIDSVEDDVFGMGYKVVMAKLRSRTPPETDRAVLQPIVDALFPTHPPFEWPAIEADSEVEAVPPITTKPGKPRGEASSHRPLLMLGSVSKVFERLILNRLNEHLEESNNTRLSPSQYGFRRGRSTVQAIQRVVEQGQHARSFHRTNRRDPRCLMVAALDVRNAFNAASCEAIALALQEMRVPATLQRILRSYFSERELVYESSEGPVRRKTSAGVPQGSILGPTLWNAMYDGGGGLCRRPRRLDERHHTTGGSRSGGDGDSGDKRVDDGAPP